MEYFRKVYLVYLRGPKEDWWLLYTFVIGHDINLRVNKKGTIKR